jgi:predicted nucleic acid-binding protein
MIFLDTGYLLALFDPADELRTRAMSWSLTLRVSCLLTEYVLWECVNALSQPADRSTAHMLVDYLSSEPGYEIVPASPGLFAAGLRLHRERSDKAWSLTDCISFHVMRERGVQRALAYDGHFEQAGFVALLRHPPPGTAGPDKTQ